MKLSGNSVSVVLEWRLCRLSRRPERIVSISEFVPRLWTLSDGDRRPRRLRSPAIEDMGSISGVRQWLLTSSISGVPSCIEAGEETASGVFSLASVLVRS